jgi:DNA polymerase-3 subunit chi
LSKVSFYLLNDAQAKRDALACRLCQRALQEGLPLFVWCATQDDLTRFDQLLWTFQKSSFIPHEIDDLSAPICLSTHLPDDLLKLTERKVGCLNLTDTAIDATHLKHFDRVLEIVEANDSAKALGRERFKVYKQHGMTPVTHALK